MNESWLNSESESIRSEEQEFGSQTLNGDVSRSTSAVAEYDCRWLDPNFQVNLPAQHTGQSFPLSLLIFLFTLASIFFAFWRISPEAAFVMLFLLTPGLIRTMWVVEHKRSEGELVPFTEQAMMWTSSSFFIILTIVLSSLAAIITFALMGVSGYFLGTLFPGSYAGESGMVMGVVLGLPLGCAAGVLVAACLFNAAWGRNFGGPRDMRN